MKLIVTVSLIFCVFILNGQKGKAPAVYLRKTFNSEKKVQSAIVSLCGLGLFEFYMNGQRIGISYLDPAFSDYQKRVYYLTYDVTKKVQSGENTIGTILGNGWYNLIIPHVLRYYAADYIAPPKLLLELNITYTDGSVKTISSDKTWRFFTDGPIRFNCLLGARPMMQPKKFKDWTVMVSMIRTGKQLFIPMHHRFRLEKGRGHLYS